MIVRIKSTLLVIIIVDYQNKEKLYLERAIQHDYFAGH